ncbi:MAG: hypothetical protein V4649_12965 [Bacteroidota bacterium]
MDYSIPDEAFTEIILGILAFVALMMAIISSGREFRYVTPLRKFNRCLTFLAYVVVKSMLYIFSGTASYLLFGLLRGTDSSSYQGGGYSFQNEEVVFALGMLAPLLLILIAKWSVATTSRSTNRWIFLRPEILPVIIITCVAYLCAI